MCSTGSTCWVRPLAIFGSHWNKAITRVCLRFWKRRRKRNGTAMLWEIDIHPSEGQPDRAGERVASAARELGIADGLNVAAARGYLVQGESLERADVERLADELLADHVVERAVVGRVGESNLNESGASDHCVTVLLKPGVMNPVSQSVLTAANDLGIRPEAVATLRKYWLSGADDAVVKALSTRLLANDAIEQVFLGPLLLD